MTMESFSFDRGMNRKKKNLLFLEEGELYSCSGFSFGHDGVLEAREPTTKGEAIDITATSIINGIHRYDDDIYASSKALCYGTVAGFIAAGLTQPKFNYIYHRTTGAFSNIDILSGDSRPRFIDYEDFTFVVDGESKRAYIDENAYEWGIDAPINAPILTSTAGAYLPDGTYQCYYTFYIKFPNGKYVETGPSPVAEITVITDRINWDGIQICSYQGSGLTIHRRLYRAVSGIAYLVTTLTDNITQTFSDNVDDTTLQDSTILGTEDYLTPPDDPEDIALYLQRIFLIKENKLYYTDAYVPFGFLTTGEVITKREGENLVGIINWGDQLYIVSIEEWYRLQGTDPDTWAIKRTFTDNGINNRNTLKKSKYGLIGSWHDGIYLFDGSITRNITEKILGKEFFKDLDYSVYYAEFDGTRYYFHYASSGTTVDSCIVIDFTNYPTLRIYQDDFLADAEEFYKESNHRYLVKGGYEYEESGNETIITSLITGDKAFQALLRRKCMDYLYYDLDSNSKDVSVSILIDGSVAQTLTLNTASRIRKRSEKLMGLEGYRFALQITCADSQDLEIYAPWGLEATPVGE